VPIRFLPSSLAALGACLIVATSLQNGVGLRAALMTVGAQTELPLERVAVGATNANEERTYRREAPPRDSSTKPTRAQRSRLLHLQDTPAMRSRRDDYKYWT
jgi:hypothetical protein